MTQLTNAPQGGLAEFNLFLRGWWACPSESLGPLGGAGTPAGDLAETQRSSLVP